jgi:uncharacterized protein with PhoU and TrkA domain
VASVSDIGEPVLRLVGEAKLTRLTLAAGDVLVVKVDRTLDSYMSNRIYGTIKPHLPEGVRVLVIDPAIELSVLTCADIEQMAG